MCPKKKVVKKSAKKKVPTYSLVDDQRDEHEVIFGSFKFLELYFVLEKC